MAEGEYIINKMDYLMSLSDYKDNFVLTNVSFNLCGRREEFMKHFIDWFGSKDFMIVCGRQSDYNYFDYNGIDTHNLIHSTEFTKVRHGVSIKYEYVEEYLKKGKIILFGARDVRVLISIKFYFGINGSDVKTQLIRQHGGFNGGVDYKFNRIVYYDDDLYVQKEMREQKLTKLFD